MYDCVELSCRHYKGPEDGGHIDSDVNGVLLELFSAQPVQPYVIQHIGHLDGHGQDIIPSWPKQVTVFQKSLCTLVAHKI